MRLDFPFLFETVMTTYQALPGRLVVVYAQEALSARTEVIKMAAAVYRGDVAPFRLGFSPFVSAELLEGFRRTLRLPETAVPIS
jgi:hypothetical protein